MITEKDLMFDELYDEFKRTMDNDGVNLLAYAEEHNIDDDTMMTSSTSTSSTIPGRVIFIPYGKLLVLPAHTIHGGGFRTTPITTTNQQQYQEEEDGNLRFHLYIARNQAKLPQHQTNKYTEPNDKSKELSYRYVDSPLMNELLDCLFV